MYKRFFGFRERPFKLVPDPAYLYLSRSHEEAMAHLTYAASQGDGFVEITGEVGTGKTTLCRAFLESLDINTEAAYIFNPKLDAIQLLKSINDEFGIPSDADNTKDLIDTLNDFLIEKKTEGKKAVLLIDEAQNLTKEVLEQLRLLSNLETTKDKLLQIILVGQPELGEMLDSYELRQLGQRITLSCHLTPLSHKETREYIQHRINISSKKPGIRFDRTAMRSIYNYSRGIPRLINIVCDRSLLTAFGLNRYRVTGNIVKASIRELSGKRGIKRGSLHERKTAILIFSLLCLALFMIILDQLELPNTSAIFKLLEKKDHGIFRSELSEKKRVTKPVPDPEPSTVINVPEMSNDMNDIEIMLPEPAETEKAKQKPIPDLKKEVVKPEPVVEPIHDLENFLKGMDTLLSRRMALQGAIERWRNGAEIKPYLDDVDEDKAFFRLAAKQSGMLILPIECNLNMIKNLNLPAVLELHSPGRQAVGYLTIVRIDDANITLAGVGENKMIEVNANELEPYWSGIAYIPWKNFLLYRGTIPTKSSKETILTLKIHLRDIGFDEIEISPVYDRKTKKAVREIQKKHGIPVDGFVGPLTKIVLYNEDKSLKIPHLRD